MRKLEAVAKEIVDELGYLQKREMRMRDTNGELQAQTPLFSFQDGNGEADSGRREYQRESEDVCGFDHARDHRIGDLAGESSCLLSNLGVSGFCSPGTRLLTLKLT